MNVAKVMSPNPTVVHPEDRLERALHEMEVGSIHHLPVVDKKEVMVGLVTFHDLLTAQARGAHRISEVMRTDIKTVAPDTHAHEAAYLLLRHKIGCVPVTDAGGKLAGIVTEGDFVRIAYTLLGGRVPVDQLEIEEEEANRV